MIDQQILDNAYSYQSYKELSERLIDEGKTTGANQSESYVHYTSLNYQRVKRLDKTSNLTDEMQNALAGVKDKQIWLVLVEAWCGDVAQNLPIINKMAESNPNIELRVILRDEHLEIMDAHLTSGGRSIPKLIILKADTLEDLGDWGPRPDPIQGQVMEYKKDSKGVPYSEFSKGVQQWYNQDKNATIQKEFIQLLKQVSEKAAA